MKSLPNYLMCSWRLFPGAKGRLKIQPSSCPLLFSSFLASPSTSAVQPTAIIQSSLTCLWASAHTAFSTWNTVSSSFYFANFYFMTQLRFHLFWGAEPYAKSWMWNFSWAPKHPILTAMVTLITLGRFAYYLYFHKLHQGRNHVFLRLISLQW